MQTQSIHILRHAMAILVVLSVSLLLWQHYGMTKVLRLDASTPNAYQPVDDRSQGGLSHAEVSRQNNAMVLQCDIRKSAYQWPYCQIRITLAPMPNGINLAGYDYVIFDLSRSGPGPEKVRVYLNNFETQSSVNDSTSLKVNELLLDIKNTQSAIPLNLFRVASWWVEYKNIPLIDTDMRINNVPVIEISTPGFAPEGKHSITIRSIEFYGKWISQTRLLFVIVASWLAFGSGWLGFELFAYRQRLQQEKKQRDDLETINRVLEIQAEVLSTKAQLDPLTGALNRDGLRELLQKEWPHTLPADAQLSILFADLDHFKQINDRYGHAIGDEVLKQFASLVKSKIRKTDGFVRWGGEEFLIACPHMPAELAIGLAEKIRSSICEAQWPESIAVTCSCGVASLVAGEDFDGLIERADKALYQAKRGGRNRVEVG
ncbi:GGDEF domain-containing protein [Chitinibacter fontanus]|uniref:diguanylate cyclase n=1 Tax=Chitinibacter fontanus TaxID=1737446 RepID=A0A7D5Z6L8_9NEIS|nr:GGDEF domain-containing protein [Chitinibacter fontanus]QLI81362.1 GGDEF domain-containing protein [Chitinibacter fontanus]